MGLSFSWDQQKADANVKKHGVEFAQAITVFADILSLTVADPDHSHDEERLLTTGMSRDGQVLVVVHTDSGDDIRVISARAATPRERRQYEDRGR